VSQREREREKERERERVRDNLPSFLIHTISDCVNDVHAIDVGAW
jgi:hypothetical protein